MVLRLGLAAGFLLVFAAICVVVSPAGHQVDLDLAIATSISNHRSAAGITFFGTVSFCGSVIGIVPISLAPQTHTCA